MQHTHAYRKHNLADITTKHSDNNQSSGTYWVAAVRQEDSQQEGVVAVQAVAAAAETEKVVAAAVADKRADAGEEVVVIACWQKVMHPTNAVAETVAVERKAAVAYQLKRKRPTFVAAAAGEPGVGEVVVQAVQAAACEEEAE